MSSLTTHTLDCTRELNWLAEHQHEYAGQWVALAGDRLLSHGTDPRQVYQRAREMGIDAPVLKRIREPHEELPFGGW